MTAGAPTFWLDSVSFHALDPIAVKNDIEKFAQLFINTTEAPITIDLGDSLYEDLDSDAVSRSLELAGPSLQVLLLLAQGGEGEEEGGR